MAPLGLSWKYWNAPAEGHDFGLYRLWPGWFTGTVIGDIDSQIISVAVEGDLHERF